MRVTPDRELVDDQGLSPLTNRLIFNELRSLLKVSLDLVSNVDKRVTHLDAAAT